MMRFDPRDISEARKNMSDNEYQLRYMLWLRHGCDMLYGDDGEMQCASCMIDFMRDTVDHIQERFTLIFNKKLAEKKECDRIGGCLHKINPAWTCKCDLTQEQIDGL